MQNKAPLCCLLAVIVGILPASLSAGKTFKNAPTDLKGRKIASYRVVKTRYRKISEECMSRVPLIDLIEDIIALKPVFGGYVMSPERHAYDITCMSEFQIGTAQLLNITVAKGIFAIPAIGTILGTLDGATYKLMAVEKIKATLKSPEQITLCLWIRR